MTLQRISSKKGDIEVLNLPEAVPFVVARIYFLRNTTAGSVRGNHALRNTHQLLAMLSGTATVNLDNGVGRTQTFVNPDSPPLHITPNVWRSIEGMDSSSVMLVLASTTYDPNDYIHDYEAFLESL